MAVNAQDMAELASTEANGFGAKRAIVAFLAGLVAQVVTTLLLAMIIGMCLGVMAAAQGGKPPDPQVISAEVQKTFLMPFAIVSVVVGAYVVLRVVRPCFPSAMASGATASLGWCHCNRKMFWRSVAVGVAISLITLASSSVFPPPDGQLTGPLATASATVGWQRFAWAVLVVLVAPPTEEFIFRGVLYGGFSKSWGKAAATIVVTLLFVAMHLTEAKSYWPALTGISLLAVGTLVARRASGSLLPAIALHAAYNTSLVIFVYMLAGK